MKKIFQFIFSSTAQKEVQILHLGQNADFDFSTIPATAISNGQINIREGVSSISDNLGEFLFYQ